MQIKANLKIQLLADDVIVAESNDPILWNKVLQTAQQSAEAPKLLTHNPTNLEPETTSYVEPIFTASTTATGSNANNPLQRLAQTLGITPEAIEGACYPSLEEPYLRIDSHYWESFKKNTPARGKAAISAAAAITTLLLQWFKYAGLGEVHRSVVYQVLKDLGVTNKNFDRGIKTCPWLSIHDSTLRLNPSAITQADALVKAFCTKQSVQG